ncbi:MAG: uroporphyrinogen-III synthase [Candidatus Acidiferrales bacterium]
MEAAKKPLTGKRVVVTRATEQAHELAHSLEALGAEVVLLPTVSFAAVKNSKPLDAALRSLAEFDWILFTSQNAVRFFCQRLREMNLKEDGLQRPRPMVAAVGTATAAAATEEGFRVDTVPKNHSGEALAQELWGAIGDRKILLPRSDRADDRLPKALREAGANVTEIVAYRTAAPDSLDQKILKSIRDAEVDAIVFASASAFRFLAECVGVAELAELSSRVQFAAIGPTTARALREEGMRVEIEASQSSAAGMADSIAKYYQRQHSAARPA